MGESLGWILILLGAVAVLIGLTIRRRRTSDADRRFRHDLERGGVPAWVGEPSSLHAAEDERYGALSVEEVHRRMASTRPADTAEPLPRTPRALRGARHATDATP